MKRENKQVICNYLCITLQQTREYEDLNMLEFKEEQEEVVATFDSGFQKRVNVACDSGSAMIRDILRAI